MEKTLVVGNLYRLKNGSIRGMAKEFVEAGDILMYISRMQSPEGVVWYGGGYDAYKFINLTTCKSVIVFSYELDILTCC